MEVISGGKGQPRCHVTMPCAGPLRFEGLLIQLWEGRHLPSLTRQEPLSPFSNSPRAPFALSSSGLQSMFVILLLNIVRLVFGSEERKG